MANHPAVVDIEIVEETINTVTDIVSFCIHDNMDLLDVMWARMYLEVVTQLSMRACTHDQMHAKVSKQRMRIGKLLIKEAYSALQYSDTQRLKHMYN